MDLGQFVAERSGFVPWNDRLLPLGRFDRNGEDVDVFAVRAAATRSAQVVAGHARRVVVNGAQAIAAVGPGIVHQPLAQEDLLAWVPGGPDDLPGAASTGADDVVALGDDLDAGTREHRLVRLHRG